MTTLAMHPWPVFSDKTCPAWCAGDHDPRDAHYRMVEVIEVTGDRPIDVQIEQEPDGAPVVSLGVDDLLDVKLTWEQARTLRQTLAECMAAIAGTATAVTR